MANPEQEIFELCCRLPDGRQLAFQIDSPAFTIGRLPSNQIHIPLDTISKTHAEARRIAPGTFLLQDRNSLNGVLVGGKPVQECELRAPCEFHLGTLPLQLRKIDPPANPVAANPRRSPFTLLLLLLLLTGIGFAGFHPLHTQPPLPEKIALHSPEPEPLPLTATVESPQIPSFRVIPPALNDPAPSTTAIEERRETVASEKPTVSEPQSELPAAASPPPASLIPEGPQLISELPAAPKPEPVPQAETPPSLPETAPGSPEPKSTPESAPGALLEPFFAANKSASKPSSKPAFKRPSESPATPKPQPVAPFDSSSKKKAQKNPKTTPAPPSTKNLTVLILGDSLSLCGFGKRLDSRFRQSGQVKATYTYMACGTVPLSWIKTPGYAQAKTCCGYWSIEQNGAKTKQTQDTYGMTRGYKPGSHPVPKVEDLLPKLRPDILVIQTGTNLFGLFPDTKTIHPDRHDNLIRSHIEPFLARLLTPSSPLRKIYWVAPPTSGRIAEPVQNFVFDRYEKYATPVVTLIDSRPLISFPYSGMQPDREHFMGADMDRWADQVYDRILADFADTTPPLLSKIPVTKATPVSLPSPETAPSQAHSSPQNQPVSLKGRLLFKSPPLQTEQLLPYQESLAAFVYEVVSVSSGQYPGKEILVLHPAHIRLEPQNLDAFQIGETYDLTVQDLDASPWASIKSSDQSGKPELLPFIQSIDDQRFPSRGK